MEEKDLFVVVVVREVGHTFAGNRSRSAETLPSSSHNLRFR